MHVCWQAQDTHSIKPIFQVLSVVNEHGIRLGDEFGNNRGKYYPVKTGYQRFKLTPVGSKNHDRNGKFQCVGERWRDFEGTVHYWAVVHVVYSVTYMKKQAVVMNTQVSKN